MFGSSKSSTTASGDPSASVTDDDVECPEIQVRSGASTLSISGKSSAPDADPSALELRYQGSIVRTARECHVVAGNLAIKVGIEGRVVLGPVGGPGQLEVPLRLAVVQEGPQPKTIMSKLARIPVTIAPESDRVSFTHIDQDVTFPLPKPLSLLESYIVYVGFDANALQPEKPKAKPAPKRKR
jgi:hypothetical protein